MSFFGSAICKVGECWLFYFCGCSDFRNELLCWLSLFHSSPFQSVMGISASCCWCYLFFIQQLVGDPTKCAQACLNALRRPYPTPEITCPVTLIRHWTVNSTLRLLGDDPIPPLWLPRGFANFPKQTHFLIEVFPFRGLLIGMGFDYFKQRRSLLQCRKVNGAYEGRTP